MRRMTDRVLPVRLAGLEAQWFSLDCVAAHAGFPLIRLPELSRRRPSTPLHVPGRHSVEELWPGLGCVRTGTAESPIKIVPRDADKDSHMALSDHLANRQAPNGSSDPPCAMAQKRTIVVAKALPLLFSNASALLAGLLARSGRNGCSFTAVMARTTHP